MILLRLRMSMSVAHRNSAMIICNNNQSVCDVKYFGYSTVPQLGLTCYDPTRQSCLNDTLCYNQYVCGSQCLTEYWSACEKDQTICYSGGFNLNSNEKMYLQACGPQKQCYDSRQSVCLGDNGTLCLIGSQLCSGECYNPQLRFCTTDNGTNHCLIDPSAPGCPIPI